MNNGFTQENPGGSFQKSFWNYLGQPRFGIFKKFLLSFLIISILPLLAFGIYTILNLSSVGENIVQHAKLDIDRKTQETMEVQAVLVAEAVQKFLRQCETDLLMLKQSSFSAAEFLQFSRQHHSEVWIRKGTNEEPIEEQFSIPLYKEIAFIGTNGQEKIKVKNSRLVRKSGLVNVKNPKNTTYLNEDYFIETSKLSDGEIYVSHLAGFFVNKKEQLGDAESPEDAVEGKKYNGVIRFATPVYSDGKLSGILMIALNHQHLMEFTQHILPNKKSFTVFPVYNSGNYAFMFDDRGWIITHPKLWDIPGVDKNGIPVPAYTEYSSKEDIETGRIPFNLDSTGFIHKSYPYVASEIRKKHSGSIITTNAGGIKKVMSYAPIYFDDGVYSRYGIFGGITIGSNVEIFHNAANQIATDMNVTVLFYRNNILWIILITFIVAAVSSWFISRNFTKPLLQITEGAKKLADGKLDKPVEVTRNDEIGFLSSSFNYMAEELKRKNQILIKSLNELKISKGEIENYAFDLEYQLKIFKSILRISNILGSTFDLDRVLNYILHNSVESIGFDRAILYLLDNKENSLVCREVYGFTPEEEERARNSKYSLHHFDCIETRVVKNGNIIFVDDINKYPEATDLDKKIRKISGSKSFVFVPLRIREKIIGILGADKLRSKTKISELDVNSLQILANQASRVIENTRLVQEIITQRNFNEDVLKFMPDGLITVDKAGKINSINPAANNILETEEQNILGKNFWELFGYDSRMVEEINSSIIINGVYRKYNREFLINEKTKFITVTASPMNNQDNENSGTVLILQNNTEKKLLDDQIQKMDRLASLGKFAAGIAHEIRNPLTGLSLFLDDLHDKINNQPNVSKNIEMGLLEVERLESFVNELLDYSSPAKQKPAEKNINYLIEATLHFIDKQCRNSNILIRTELFADIPSVFIDQEKIRQALLNILLNAIHAMPQGGQLKIKTSYVKNKRDELILNSKNGNNRVGLVMIQISDTGPGIPESIINKIFDPFFTNKKGGTGLGLSITQNIITEHKGKIKVANSKYGGAVFSIHLPVVSIKKKELLPEEV
jgi:PAS domain S-box-containing protein